MKAAAAAPIMEKLKRMLRATAASGSDTSMPRNLTTGDCTGVGVVVVVVEGGVVPVKTDR